MEGIAHPLTRTTCPKTDSNRMKKEKEHAGIEVKQTSRGSQFEGDEEMIDKDQEIKRYTGDNKLYKCLIHHIWLILFTPR